MPLRLSSPPACRALNRLFRPPAGAPFHTLPARRSDSPSHYETLGVEPDASQASIKKQFYALSKTHHPDHNPSDPSASARFVAISEAYATVGNPGKRERYDREVMRTRTPSPSSPRRTGSRSGPFGARPASGLSKRRTRFQGPPPSFYSNGGWGAQDVKRSASAAGNAASDSASTAGGFSPGQGAPRGYDNDVPHWDREAHFRRQEQAEERLRQRRKMAAAREGLDTQAGPGVWPSFFIISGVVGLACMVPALIQGGNGPRRNDDT